MLGEFDYETPLLLGCEWPYSEATEFECENKSQFN